MGKHTAYWQAYTKAQVRGTLRFLAAILVWAAIAALLAVFHEPLDSAFPWLIGSAFLGLALTLIRLGKNASKVICPECTSAYTRHKWGGACPSCGLKLLQNDP